MECADQRVREPVLWLGVLIEDIPHSVSIYSKRTAPCVWDCMSEFSGWFFSGRIKISTISPPSGISRWHFPFPVAP
ncbi:MAG: hypothetical protein KC996_07120, partial [Phycisphaerales bacterium]|nr:hypothetical protein [Phycisphaerales bacterium]